MKKSLKRLLIVMMFSMMLFATACGSGTVKDSGDKGTGNSVTDEIMSEKEEAAKQKKENQGKDVYDVTVLDLPELWYNFGITFQRWVPIIWIGSWIIAVILWDVGQNIMDVKKVAIKLFGIKIPVITVLLTIGYCNLYALICF